MFVWKPITNLWYNSTSLHSSHTIDKEMAFDRRKGSDVKIKLFFTNLKIRISKNKSTDFLNEVASVRFRDLLSWYN